MSRRTEFDRVNPDPIPPLVLGPAAVQAGAGQAERNARTMRRGSIALLARAIAHLIEARELLEHYAPVASLPPTSSAEPTDLDGALSFLRHAVAEGILYGAVCARLIEGTAVKALP